MGDVCIFYREKFIGEQLQAIVVSLYFLQRSVISIEVVVSLVIKFLGDCVHLHVY